MEPPGNGLLGRLMICCYDVFSIHSILSRALKGDRAFSGLGAIGNLFKDGVLKFGWYKYLFIINSSIYYYLKKDIACCQEGITGSLSKYNVDDSENVRHLKM